MTHRGQANDTRMIAPRPRCSVRPTQAFSRNQDLSLLSTTTFGGWTCSCGNFSVFWGCAATAYCSCAVGKKITDLGHNHVDA
jgi:hypothetical protein